MSKFIIENEFLEVFPNAKVGIVVCNNIDNTPKNEDIYKSMLASAMLESKKHLTDETFSNNSAIKVWREAFQKFKTKKGVRSSIESLLKRVNGGGEIGNINPLVDIYNSISLRYALPCGGEDIDTFVGNVRLTKATGDEEFIILGSMESAPPFPEEVIYKDDAGAICRCWNWRESKRTMLTEETTNAFMCIELVDESREEDFNAALNELSTKVAEHLGGSTRVVVLSRENAEMYI